MNQRGTSAARHLLSINHYSRAGIFFFKNGQDNDCIYISAPRAYYQPALFRESTKITPTPRNCRISFVRRARARAADTNYLCHRARLGKSCCARVCGSCDAAGQKGWDVWLVQCDFYLVPRARGAVLFCASDARPAALCSISFVAFDELTGVFLSPFCCPSRKGLFVCAARSLTFLI